jgi:hypothetical protein
MINELTFDTIMACQKILDDAPVPSEDRHILYMSDEDRRRIRAIDFGSEAEKKNPKPDYRFYDPSRW